MMNVNDLNMMITEIESKIFDALISLGLKPSKILVRNQECHFIAQNKINNKNLRNYSLQLFYRTPFYKKAALESVQVWTFILRPDNSGRRISTDEKLLSYKLFDTLLYTLN